MFDLQRHSPLPKEANVFSTAGFQLREIERVTKLRVQALRRRGLQTPAADPHQLPDKPNTAIGTDPIALWKAPDDWLVLSQTLTCPVMRNWIATISSDTPLIVTDASSASVVLELAGPLALNILMRDCTLDLEGDAIPPGACAQTQFAQTTVMIHRPVDSDKWHLFIERSVANHVWEWLLDTSGSASESRDCW